MGSHALERTRNAPGRPVRALGITWCSVMSNAHSIALRNSPDFRAIRCIV
jgi:hypothetical protein